MDYKKAQKLPDAPGVYFFLDKRKKILYIGKATSLQDRVKSYFAGDLIETRGPLLVKMIEEAHKIEYKETASVLEALLLEADLIKKFRPAYNTKEKDDKSFLCVVITKEDFPQILTIRKKDLSARTGLAEVYGPFTSGSQLKEALKIIRKIFPYRDEKCKLNSKRPCFNYSIGLCPGTCIGAIDKHCYAIRIRRIKLFLSGNIKKLTSDLEKDMKSLAKEHKFEAAKILRDKIYALNHVQDVALIKDDNLRAGSILDAFRIESYDIAHMGGKNMVGVMVVLSGGMLDKSAYRKFKIRGFENANDPGALKEMLSRRLNHPEWPMANLIVVDGGVAQINVMNQALKERGVSIPVLSVVKDDKHKAKGLLGDVAFGAKYKKEILLSNVEAHRFAIGYHKKLRNKNFLR
ncbi:MAG: GIY-YIG nuclease family protein [Patescibacteria group bacterium]